MSSDKTMAIGRTSLNQRLKECLLGATARDRRNNRRITFWLVTWGITFGFTLHKIQNLHERGALAWGLLILSTATGIMAVRAIVRFLRETDEMIRRIHVNALAFAFAAGLIVWMASQVVPALGGPVLSAGRLMAIMYLALAGKLLWSLWRYK